MATTQRIGVVAVVLGISLWAVAQNDTATSRTGPAPAFGQTAPVLDPDNPPISGLDEPGLDMRGGTRSFISGGLAVAESGDTNASNEGKQALSSVTHVLGAFDLQRFYAKTDLFAEYFGGGAFYSNATRDVTQLHALGTEGVIRWRTGRFTLRDAFNYLPDGSFSMGAFGGVPGLHLATGGFSMGGLPGLRSFGNESTSAVGLTPRLTNTAVADLVQSVNPRAAFTLAVGFSNAHFFDNTENLINSDQLTAEGGYSYMVGRRDQIAGVYGFQQFRFPQTEGGEIRTHIANFRWSHYISGRMRLVIGAGPQYTTINDLALGLVNRWSVSGRAQLHYKFTRTSVSVGYEKFTGAGSGFFPGTDTQLVRAGLNRPLARTWEFTGDLGYSHNKRLQTQGEGGLPGNSFNNGFVGGILRKHLGREYSVFGAYRFNELTFDRSACGVDSACSNRITHRNIGTIGVEWHPRPLRIE